VTGPLERVWATPGFHRAVPMPVAGRLARLRARAAWRVSVGVRADAEAQMHFLLGRSSRAGEVTELAAEHVYENVMRNELHWRDWITTRMPVAGVEVLRRPGGALLNFFHHGPYGGIFGSLARHGVRVHVATHPIYLEAQPTDFAGLRHRQHLTTVSTGGTPTFNSVGSYGYMRDLLRRGEIVALATDLPGSTPMTFLGRRVRAASGAARLALETGAPIVPISGHPHGWGMRLSVQEPIDPRAFADVEALQGEIARRHEPAVLAWPQAVEWPMGRFRPAEEPSGILDAIAGERATSGERPR
jgi:lauroyl/myristoyl acyltransferase